MNMDFEDDDPIESDVEVSDEEDEYKEKLQKQAKVETLSSKMLDQWSEDLTVSLLFYNNRI